MCGRFNLVVPDLDELKRYVTGGDFTIPSDVWRPRYNIAPSQRAPVLHIAKDGRRRIELMAWGLVPRHSPFAEKPHPFNARLETLRERPSFRHLVGTQQCLVPATGYYEWSARNASKQPWLIAPPNGLLMMAGLWDRWHAKTGEVVDTFTVVTRPATPNLAAIHHRMPLLLSPAESRIWIEGGAIHAAATEAVSSLSVTPLSNRVNRADHDVPDVLEPAEPIADSQLSLPID